LPATVELSTYPVRRSDVRSRITISLDSITKDRSASNICPAYNYTTLLSLKLSLPRIIETLTLASKIYCRDTILAEFEFVILEDSAENQVCSSFIEPALPVH
jgi:hypothetical protein